MLKRQYLSRSFVDIETVVPSSALVTKRHFRADQLCTL